MTAVEPLPGWNAARERVLTRYASVSEAAAVRLRGRAPMFPAEADGILADAAALDWYAAECRAAAADPSLPTPDYLPEEG